MTELNLSIDPSKQHIILTRSSEDRIRVAADLTTKAFSHCVIHGSIDDEVIAQFSNRVFQVLVMPAILAGWRTTLTDEECDVHFVGEFDDVDREIGRSRVMRLVDAGPASDDPLPNEVVMYTKDEYDAMAKVAEANRLLAQELLQRLAESGTREGIMRDTVRLNHEWHQHNADNDPAGDSYTDSGLDEANTKALALPEDDTALRIVLTNKNPVEMVRHFNRIAGNTDDRFNVRQAAMYFGLQLEEMAEKLNTVATDDQLLNFAHTMDVIGTQFKTGRWDFEFTDIDRKAVLDDDIDQLVVTIGSLLAQGADIHGAVAEVHRANMDKVWPDGTMHRNEFGKIVKPDGWREPDLSPFVYVDEFNNVPLGAPHDETDPNACQCKDEQGAPLMQCDECPR